jgi:putative DNA methylase
MVVVLRPRSGAGGCVVRPGFTEEVMEEASRAFAEVYGRLGLSLVDALMAANSAAFKAVSRCWPLYGPDGSPYPLEKLEGVVNKAVAKAFTSNVLGGEVDGWSVAYLIARRVYGEPSYDDLRRLGAGLGINHEEFIKTYCGEERESRGERVYPVLPLTGISGVRPGRLVDALAAAVGAVKTSVDAAAERLRAAGFKLEGRVCRYIEELMPAAEDEEKELLAALLAKCGRPQPQTTLDKFF